MAASLTKKAASTTVAQEREACAKLAEGRAIYHKHAGHGVAAREAQAIADAIRSRTQYPQT